ncbi:MAG: MBL fold metallo-hydrolase [Dehalococcoidia bacterium]|nr:MBL fold metallo-hydrolase [Dehalococcoidia bacterium]MDW8009576.1 MBL fold metallo-hydrolase [Chloroflexota bacterium]
MARIHEIAEGIYRISTFLQAPTPNGGITFNQYLIVDQEPLLWHTGSRGIFPETIEAVRKVLDPSRLRYISWSHWEADEAGALNEFLQAAPNAEPVCGLVGAIVNVGDFSSRRPRVVNDDEVLVLGRRRLRFLITPHVPHNWDAILAFEETEGILLASDLFTHFGDPPPVVESDVVGPSLAADAFMRQKWRTTYYPIGPHTARVFDRLEALKPRVAACMHGAAFAGDVVRALRDLRSELYRGLQT